MPLYGQIIIGPAGAGKTTFCTGMQQLLAGLGRTAYVVNLDPGNIWFSPPLDEDVPQRYSPSIDVAQAYSQWGIMNELSIGPNAALVEAMRKLADPNDGLQWLVDQFRALISRHDAGPECLTDKKPSRVAGDSVLPYFIIDSPGQAELITHEPYLSTIFSVLEREFQLHLVVVCLVDASTCKATKERLVSTKLLSLSAMTRLELPFVNVFSKIDLLSTQEQNELMEEHEGCYAVEAGPSKIWTLLEELTDEMAYVEYIPVAVEDKKTMLKALDLIDRANGYFYHTD